MRTNRTNTGRSAPQWAPGSGALRQDHRSKLRFVVHRHMATRLHYDLRLELGGVLKSWAVPKGPSMNPADRRLAVRVDDHPLRYVNFSGVIPQGDYGAGTVEIWDKGQFVPVDGDFLPVSEAEAMKALEDGELKFILNGKRFSGGFVLIRLKKDRQKWLMVKHRDPVTPGSPVGDGDTKHTGNFGKDEHQRSMRKTATHNEPEAVARMFRTGKASLELSNLNKVYWPADGYTKGDMLDYYEMMAPWILPYLKDRPLSLKRFPDGIDGSYFFHKNAGEHAPSFAKTVPVRSVTGDKVTHYLVCNNVATLMYVANLGSIEMNPWSACFKKPNHPSYLVLDIDPSEKNSFAEVVETARAAGEVLGKADARFYCKTSGASGLHIYVPFHAKYTFQQVGEFAMILATRTRELVPGITTLERVLEKRGDRIYLDTLQNRIGQTVACAYSLRPVPGAHVSTPLLWKEVKLGLHPSMFNIRNMHSRLRKMGDLFAPVLGRGNDMGRCLKNLGY